MVRALATLYPTTTIDIVPIPPTTTGSPLTIAAPKVPMKADTTASGGELLTATAVARITVPRTIGRMPDWSLALGSEAAA